jgi:hypothetical protein
MPRYEKDAQAGLHEGNLEVLDPSSRRAVESCGVWQRQFELRQYWVSIIQPGRGQSRRTPRCTDLFWKRPRDGFAARWPAQERVRGSDDMMVVDCTRYFSS